MLVFCVVLLTLAFAWQVHSLSIKIINEAGEPIDVFWVNPTEDGKFTEEDLTMLNTEPVLHNEEVDFSTYPSHRFLFRFTNHKAGVELMLTKTSVDETVTIVSTGKKSKLVFKEATRQDEISAKIRDITRACPRNSKEEDYASCVARELQDDYNRIVQEKSRFAGFRSQVASHLRNYTCEDFDRPTSTPISSYQFSGIATNGEEYSHEVKIMLDHSHAKIWTIDNFISAEECDVLINHGRPKLHRATVAAEDGSSTVSENRKAQQASYDVHQVAADPLWPLYQKVLDVANHHTGYHLTPDGQESFTIIQYNPTDQYTPHCDASCDGSEFSTGGRIATAVLYCKVADLGGATTFTNSNIHVKPVNGSVTFFAYRGPDLRMDPESLTEHSGCPVAEGEKWITTFWMRGGVTREEPWGLFDPSGVKLMTAD